MHNRSDFGGCLRYNSVAIVGRYLPQPRRWDVGYRQAAEPDDAPPGE